MGVCRIVKAILDVVDGLGVSVNMCHTGRRCSVGEMVADHLIKGEMMEAEGLRELRKV